MTTSDTAWRGNVIGSVARPSVTAIVAGGRASLQFALPRQAVSLIVVEW